MSYSNRGIRKQSQPSNNPALARSPVRKPGASLPPVKSTRDEFDAVPMEYRAQVKQRCQRHYVEKKPNGAPNSWRSNIQQWHDEWLKGINTTIADGEGNNHCGDSNTLIEEIEIDWRLLTNSGVDEGFIRPVINSRGWPLIPGSSIKGLFRNQWLKQGLPSDQLENLCGSRTNNKPLHQGLLRFHSVHVRERSCLERSLDITHSQENWQLGTIADQRKIERKAIGLVSLWKPKLRVVISSQPKSITAEQWKIIRDVLIQSVAAGIGGRTAAGYGRTRYTNVYKEVFSCQLRGQGIAPKLLDVSGSAEFRPVSLRAAIRGMAMRLFAGLLPAQLAVKQVERLFGSLNGPTVGLLACHFQESEPISIGIPVGPFESGFGFGRWKHQPPAVMDLKGSLVWELVRPCAYRQELSRLIAVLHGLVMSLGGFSKGWRRVDHRLFPLYHDQTYYAKTPIGCHWDWIGLPADQGWIQVRSRPGLEELLEKARECAFVWLETQGIRIPSPPLECPSRWREVIHPKKMFVWARQAETHEDCIAIDWFHRDQIKSGKPDIRDVRFKGSSLTGQASFPSKVGHVWHRMLPLHLNSDYDYEPIAEAYADQDKIIPKIWTGTYLEVVTFFAGMDNRSLENDFLQLMNKASGGQGANFKPVRFA
jgi:CRISPR-associated protein Cmr6